MEEEVGQLNKQLVEAEEQQKKLILTILHNFLQVLSMHIERCENNGKDVNSMWYISTMGRLKEMFIIHGPLVLKYKDSLKTLLFNEKERPELRKTFEQFLAVQV